MKLRWLICVDVPFRDAGASSALHIEIDCPTMKNLLLAFEAIFGVLSLYLSFYDWAIAVVMGLLFVWTAWFIDTAGVIHVQSKLVRFGYRAYLVLFGLLLFAGADSLGRVAQAATGSEWTSPLTLVIGLAIAIHVWRRVPRVVKSVSNESSEVT